MSLSPHSLILCPTARLVRSIQADIARKQTQLGQTQWQSAPVLTLSQWLDGVIEQGLLSGRITAPKQCLSAFNEQLLWQEVITASLKKNAFGDLFDVAGLSAAAMEANKYMIAWNLHIPREHQAEESRQFVQWQRAFQQRCAQLNVLENVRYFDWQLEVLNSDALQANIHAPPGGIEFAGFDQTAPQEQRLREILQAKNISVAEYVTTHAELAQTQQISLENQEAECRAAVAWAKCSLDKNPAVKIAIVAPRLSEVRNSLANLLDDVFYPAGVRPSLADTARHYDFSLGTPLAQQPIIQAALNLLRLFSSYQLQQADISNMLISPFWSANLQESDARAILDAKMREKLPTQLTLSRLIEFTNKQHENGLNIPRLYADLCAASSVPSKNATPSQMAQTLESLLAALNWPGERSITSLEFQAINAWQKALEQLKKLDVLGKNISLSEAVNLMQQICTEQVFQTETESDSSIQILGIMEALSAPVDVMWVLQMNDHIWPPPARQNPLLPAFIQRTARVPNADNSVQAEFAATVQQRLLHSAKRIIFSSSKTEGESQLRASPLMKGIANIDAEIQLAETLAEQLSRKENDNLEHINDHIAPVVRTAEHVSGGTGLIKAQAICPAWAFYQFRLGAKALKTPSNGLDAMERGSLVHDVLEQFWQPDKKQRHFADLRDMSEADFTQALNLAVGNTLRNFSDSNKSISSTVLELEHERLYKLISDWLQYEKTRSVNFNIVACEAEKQVDICGIEVTLKIDRIHALENGAIEFIDYKTGQIPKISSWGETRITEPQLPIYAAFGADDNTHISGVQFAWVKVAEHTFSGVAEANFETEPDKRKPKFIQNFSDWHSLLTHWKTSIKSIAEEIKQGEAAVRFEDASLLMYCEVLPLLRLPERQLQFERFQDPSIESNAE
jgi:probable DNA repair protein